MSRTKRGLRILQDGSSSKDGRRNIVTERRSCDYTKDTTQSSHKQKVWNSQAHIEQCNDGSKSSGYQSYDVHVLWRLDDALLTRTGRLPAEQASVNESWKWTSFAVTAPSRRMAWLISF